MEHGFKVLRGKITIKGFYTPMLLLLRRCKVVSHFHLASSTFFIGCKRIYKRYGSIINRTMWGIEVWKLGKESGK